MRLEIIIVSKLLEILLIESSLGDIRLIQEMFKDNKLHNNLHVTRNFKETLSFLHKEGDFHQAIRPDIIFLNLIITIQEGFDLWEEIWSNEDFKTIPIVLITLSEHEQNFLKERNKDQLMQPAYYIYKPIGFDEIVSTIRKIEGFGFGLLKSS